MYKYAVTLARRQLFNGKRKGSTMHAGKEGKKEEFIQVSSVAMRTRIRIRIVAVAAVAEKFQGHSSRRRRIRALLLQGKS
jgi:hypothetical protein